MRQLVFGQSLIKWLNEFCEEHKAGGDTGGNNRLRCECSQCWQSLHEAVKVGRTEPTKPDDIREVIVRFFRDDFLYYDSAERNADKLLALLRQHGVVRLDDPTIRLLLCGEVRRVREL